MARFRSTCIALLRLVLVILGLAPHGLVATAHAAVRAPAVSVHEGQASGGSSSGSQSDDGDDDDDDSGEEDDSE